MSEITEPGVYELPADDYHADPVHEGSLSASGAKKLLPPSCPAIFAHERAHGRPEKRAFDFGHAAHKEVLGAGPELAIVDADDWRSKAAREARDEAYANGTVPLLAEEYERVQGMAAALREHPIAGKLLQPDSGKPEQSLFWRDKETGIWRRARLDWLPQPQPGRRMIVPDYKSAVCADRETLQRAIANYGYHMQAEFYIDGVETLGLAQDPAFVFIFQEKQAPYLVTVAELDTAALRIGRTLNRQAIDIYRQCTATGHWPGYSDGVELIPLPPYIEAKYAS